MNAPPTTEDRIWAVMAHLSALAFGVGVFLPIVGWSEQRRKSNYASFQCLQALGYQSLGYTIWILFALIIVILQSLKTFSTLLAAADSGADFESLVSLAMTGDFIVMMGLIGMYSLMPVVAAVACIFGKDFKYPILGHRLARYLKYDPAREGWLDEEHEDRWAAAMGHFSVIIVLWGALAPLTAWIMQGKRSQFLKFQSTQALVFQAGTLFLYFGAGTIYVIGFVSLVGATGLLDNPGVDSAAGMTGLVIFLVSSLLVFVIILLIPFFHIMGQWAGFRVLKGDAYRYPLVGRLVEKWMAKSSS